jgi:hypothetical protein
VALDPNGTNGLGQQRGGVPTAPTAWAFDLHTQQRVFSFAAETEAAMGEWVTQLQVSECVCSCASKCASA